MIGDRQPWRVAPLDPQPGIVGEDVVELLIPELQKRGVYKQDYAAGTLREKLFAAGPQLSAPHPGAGYRVRSAQQQEVI